MATIADMIWRVRDCRVARQDEIELPPDEWRDALNAATPIYYQPATEHDGLRNYFTFMGVRWYEALPMFYGEHVHRLIAARMI